MLSDQDIKDFRQLRQRLSPFLSTEQSALLKRIESGIGTGEEKPVLKLPRLSRKQQIERAAAEFM